MNHNTPNYAAWDIKPEMYPKNGGTKEQINFFVNYGILAPSTHNSQPWVFKFISDHEVRLDPDWSRVLPYSDQYNRGLFISQGCCLQNIIVAAGHFGWEVNYAIEGADQSDAHIILKFSAPSIDETLKHDELFDAITRRQSHKVPFEQKTVSADMLVALGKIKYGDAIIAYTTKRSVIDQIVRLHIDSMAAYLTNKPFSREISKWMRVGKTKKFDGMPGFTLGLSAPKSVVGKMATWLTPKSIKASAEMKSVILRSSSALGAVFTEGDDFRSWVNAGLAYERAGLLMTAEGMRLAPKAAAIEAGNRHALAKLFELDLNPQLYFGIGYGDDVVRHSPRRIRSANSGSRLL
jgi:nitroreductase